MITMDFKIFPSTAGNSDIQSRRKGFFNPFHYNSTLCPIMLNIYFEDTSIENCSSVIIIPEKAIEEAGYIQTLTRKNDASSKHEFHALAQTAYYQFQDDELPIDIVKGIIRIESGDHQDKQSGAMVICRENSGGFRACVHEGLPAKKLLEAANRFCSRWVRLDL